MVCHIPFTQTVLVFHILNIKSSGQGLSLATVHSTAFSGTAKYHCNGNFSISHEEGTSVHRPLKQKLKGSAKAKEMHNTTASALPVHHEGSHPQLQIYEAFTEAISALMSLKNQQCSEDVGVLCSAC